MPLSSSVEDVCAGPFPFRLQLMRWIGRQTWVPKGIDRLLRTIQDPEVQLSYPFEVDFFGQRYRGNLNQFIDWMVFFYGSYAYAELSLLQDIASLLSQEKQRLTYFDVGANIGHHVLFMANEVDRIIAFEPNPASCESVHDKINLNRLTNVQLVPVGLGAEDCEQVYYVRADGNSGAGTFSPEEDANLYSRKVSLHIRQGDRLCDGLCLPPIDILKIDVEGFESYVIKGLSERIHRDRPVILMELSDRSRTAFGSEQSFRESLYPSAIVAEVAGRSGCRYHLRRFCFERAQEVVILPPEMRKFIQGKLPEKHIR